MSSARYRTQYGLGAPYETILAAGSFEPAAGVVALERAGSRLQWSMSGLEYATFEEASFDDHYTPNYVSDPEVGPKSIQLHMDGKGSIEEPMWSCRSCARSWRTCPTRTSGPYLRCRLSWLAQIVIR